MIVTASLPRQGTPGTAIRPSLRPHFQERRTQTALLFGTEKAGSDPGQRGTERGSRTALLEKAIQEPSHAASAFPCAAPNPPHSSPSSPPWAPRLCSTSRPLPCVLSPSPQFNPFEKPGSRLRAARADAVPGREMGQRGTRALQSSHPG